MDSPLPSASALPIVAACPPSAALPRAEEAPDDARERGSWRHEFLANVGRLGVEKALALVPEKWRAACAALDVSKLPACEPGAFAAEVAFFYDLATGEAREVGRGLGRRYEKADPPRRATEIPGTADVVALTADGEGVFVADYKGPWAEVPPAATNEQTLFYALCAARAYGRTRATVMIFRLGEDGAVRAPDVAHFEAWAIDRFAIWLANTSQLVAELRAAYARGEVLTTKLGAHCRYCGAKRFCPGLSALVRELADPPTMADLKTMLAEELTDETAARAWARIRELAPAVKVIETVKDALKVYAAERPIPLANGKVLAVRPVEKVANAEHVKAVLTERHGPDVAEAAMELEASKSSIERALRKALPGGRGISKLMDEVMDEVRTRGGVRIEHHLREVKAPAAEGGAP